MKKLALLLLCAFIAFQGQAQDVLSDRKANNVSKQINKEIAKASKAVEDMNWGGAQAIFEKMLQITEKNTGGLLQIIDNIDVAAMQETLEGVAQQIENSVDLPALEKSMERIGRQFEDVLDKKQLEIKGAQKSLPHPSKL